MFKKCVLSFFLSGLLFVQQSNAFVTTGHPFDDETAKKVAKLYIQNRQEWNSVFMDAIKKASFETFEKVAADVNAEYNKQLMLSIEFLALDSIFDDEDFDKAQSALNGKILCKWLRNDYSAVVSLTQEFLGKEIEREKKILQERGWLEKEEQAKK